MILSTGDGNVVVALGSKPVKGDSGGHGVGKENKDSEHDVIWQSGPIESLDPNTGCKRYVCCVVVLLNWFVL